MPETAFRRFVNRKTLDDNIISDIYCLYIARLLNTMSCLLIIQFNYYEFKGGSLVCTGLYGNYKVK
jgi:predicted 2-oxoglutarate/Fe(II)-dependent dioxygenase YbiX